MKYVFVYCLGYVRLIMFLTSFFSCLLKPEASKYITWLMFVGGFWCCSWDLAVWIFARWIFPMVMLGTWWWRPGSCRGGGSLLLPRGSWVMELLLPRSQAAVSGAPLSWWREHDGSEALHSLAGARCHQGLLPWHHANTSRGASSAAPQLLPPGELSSPRVWHFPQPLRVGARDKRINGNVTL